MLLFKERFKQPVLSGTKTITRRGTARKFKVGSVHQAYTRPPFCTPPGEAFARLRVVSVVEGTLADVDEKEALLEGFSSLADFRAYLVENKQDVHSECVRIEFEVLR